MSDMRIWMVAVSSLARRLVDVVSALLRRDGRMATSGDWNAVVAARERSQIVVEIIVLLLLSL